MSTAPKPKPLVWFRGEVRTPPFTTDARIEAGVLLRRLQGGEMLGMPHCKPMPSIAPSCYELRIPDEGHNWRIIFWIGSQAIVILDVFPKTTQKTPQPVIKACQQRLTHYKQIVS